jgi:hypothetical protein
MLRPLTGFILLALAACGSSAKDPAPKPEKAAPPVNYGATKPSANKPFKTTPVATFDTP